MDEQHIKFYQTGAKSTLFCMYSSFLQCIKLSKQKIRTSAFWSRRTNRQQEPRVTIARFTCPKKKLCFWRAEFLSINQSYLKCFQKAAVNGWKKRALQKANFWTCKPANLCRAYRVYMFKIVVTFGGPDFFPVTQRFLKAFYK